MATHFIKITKSVFLVALCAAIATPSAMAQSTDQGSGKGLFLAGLVTALGQAFTQSAAQGASCVFSRLFSIFGSPKSAYCDNRAEQTNSGPQSGSNFVQPMSEDKVRQLVASPLVSFVMQRLESDLPNAPLVGEIFKAPLNGSNLPTIDIRTGDVFAIKFSTSVPGQVRLHSLGADGVPSKSDLYEAVPNEDNRMPRARQGGIKMTGAVGPETLEIEFFPCISSSQEVRDRPAVRQFISLLPSCGNEMATKQFVGAASAGKSIERGEVAKAMQFPTSSDSSQVVGIDPNFTSGTKLSLKININHMAP
jgi:hypothetical protein